MAILRRFPVPRKAAVFLPALALLAVSISCPLASAQSASKLPEVDIFGGYSYLRFDAKPLGFADSLNLNGANVSASMPDFYQGLGAAIDISGHITGQMEEFNFMIGPQYTFEWKGMRLYGHGLYGRARDRLRLPGTTVVEPSSLSRAIAFGGGVDVPFKGRFSLRAIQADYLITDEFGSSQHNVRLSTGLIYRFGKK